MAYGILQGGSGSFGSLIFTGSLNQIGGRKPTEILGSTGDFKNIAAITSSAGITLSSSVTCQTFMTGNTIQASHYVSASTSFIIGNADLNEADMEKLDGITNGTAAASKALVVDSNKDIGTLRNLTIDGTFSDGNYTFDTSGNVTGLGTVGCGAITSTGAASFVGTLTADTSLTLDTTTITTAEIGVLDGITAGTATASKALVLDSDKEIGTITSLTSSYLSCSVIDVGTHLRLDGNDLSATEFALLDGVTAGTVTANKVLAVDSNKEIGTLTSLTSSYLSCSIIDVGTALRLDGSELNAAEFAYLEGVTAGTVTADKAVVVDSAKDIGTFGNISGSHIKLTGGTTGGGNAMIQSANGGVFLRDESMNDVTFITNMGSSTALTLGGSNGNVTIGEELVVGNFQVTVGGGFGSTGATIDATGSFRGNSALTIGGLSQLDGQVTTGTSMIVGANCTVTNDLILSGDTIKDSGGTAAISFDGSTNTDIKGTLAASGHITLANTKDLLAGGADCEIGSSGTKFAAGYFNNVYTGDFHLKNERGDWTIFEEADHLRVRNNKTGQVFKMAMELIEEE